MRRALRPSAAARGDRGYVPGVRTVLVMVACVALGVTAGLVFGSPFAKDPVTKAQIERAVSERPRGGKVQVTLCNEQFVPSEQPRSKSAQTWTCDTYLGPSPAEAQNGPSYQVIVDDGEIQSIRRVPTH